MVPFAGSAVVTVHEAMVAAGILYVVASPLLMVMLSPRPAFA